MFAIDDAFADVVRSTSQPALGAIRLAWWREALERLDHGPPPPEPRLQAVASELLTRGITGAELGGLEDGWAMLLDEYQDPERVAARGARLFAFGARLLGASDERLAEAGALFALVDVARRGLARPRLEGRFRPAHRFATRLRPLTALARLAARDGRQPRMEPEATPQRAWTLMRHRLTGFIPETD